MILVNSDANIRGGGGDIFSSIKPSFVCHGYCWIALVHSLGWSARSEHKGVCLRNGSSCME